MILNNMATKKNTKFIVVDADGDGVVNIFSSTKQMEKEILSSISDADGIYEAGMTVYEVIAVKRIGFELKLLDKK